MMLADLGASSVSNTRRRYGVCGGRQPYKAFQSAAQTLMSAASALTSRWAEWRSGRTATWNTFCAFAPHYRCDVAGLTALPATRVRRTRRTRRDRSEPGNQPLRGGTPGDIGNSRAGAPTRWAKSGRTRAGAQPDLRQGGTRGRQPDGATPQSEVMYTRSRCPTAADTRSTGDATRSSCKPTPCSHSQPSSCARHRVRHRQRVSIPMSSSTRNPPASCAK